MTNQVSKKEEQQTEMQGFVPSSPFMEGLGGNDFIPPAFQLLQSTSKAVHDGVGRPGQLYSQGLGFAKDTIECVILHVQKTRTLWSEDLGQPPACSSADGINPNPGGLVEVPCAKCDYLDKDCIGGYTYLAYDLEDNYPFIIRCSTRTSLTAAKSFNTAAAMMLQGRPFLAKTTISSQSRENTKGHFFVLNIRLGERFTAEAAAQWQDLAEKMAAAYGKVAPGDGGEVPGEAPSGSSGGGAPQNGAAGGQQPAAAAQPAEPAPAPEPVEDDDLAF